MGPSVKGTYLLFLEASKQIVHGFQTDGFLLQCSNFRALDVFLEDPALEDKLEAPMDLVPHLQQASEIVLGGVVEEVLHYPHVLPVLHCFLFLAQLGDALHVILGKLVHVPIFHAALDTATYLLEHVLDFEVGLVFVLFLLAVLA